MKNLHIFVQLIFALVAVFYKRKKKVIHLRMVFWFGFQFEKKHFALTQIKTNKTGKISLPTYTYLPRTIRIRKMFKVKKHGPFSSSNEDF